MGFALGNKGYITNGYDSFNNNVYNDLWEWDQLTNTWTQKANFPGIARSYGIGFSLGNKGYIGTGFGALPYNDFWEYDQSLDLWTQKANFGGVGRSEATCFAVGSFGYVGTGTVNVGSGASSDIWKYNVSNNTWIQMTNFGGGNREFATGLSIGCKGYIGLGWINDDGNTFKNDFWEFTPDTCDPTEIVDLTKEFSISIFPNPVSKSGILQSNINLKNAIMYIYNSKGQLNKEIKNITGNSINLLNSNLESGLYFVKFTQSNLTILTYKLIITN